MSIVKFVSGKALAVTLALAMLPAGIAVPQNLPVIGSGALVGAQPAKADPWRGGGYYRGPGWGGPGPRGSAWRGPGWGGPGWRGPPRYYGGGYPGYYYRDRGNNVGAAIAGGIVGLGLGAAIASANNQPRYVERRYVAPSYVPAAWTQDWYRYCAQRYRSFDPQSGTFQPYNGPRRFCQ